MRVLHMVNGIDPANGISNVVVDLSTTQSREGDDVAVLGRYTVYRDLFIEHGVSLYEADFTKRTPVRMLRALARIRTVVREFKPDVIHVHTITPLLLLRVLCVRIPIVATVHNEWQKASDLMRWADCAVGVSEPVTQSMIERGIPAPRMRTVSNGVTGTPRRSGGEQANVEHPAVLFVGSISERKGVDVLLNAFATVHRLHRNAHLYLVGNVDWPEARELSRSLGLEDSVDFTGRQDPYRFYANADVFVLPSRSEPAPLVLLEAAELGTPLLGAQVGGIASFLEDEKGGLTFQNENAEELAELIDRVLRDPGLRAELKERSQRLATMHSVELMAAEYRSVYSAVMR